METNPQGGVRDILLSPNVWVCFRTQTGPPKRGCCDQLFPPGQGVFWDFSTQNIPNVAALVFADMEGWLTPLVD